MTNPNKIKEVLEEQVGDFAWQINSIEVFVNKETWFCQPTKKSADRLKTYIQNSNQELIRAVIAEIEKANMAEDKVGTFKEGHDCLKEQILYLLNQALNQ